MYDKNDYMRSKNKGLLSGWANGNPSWEIGANVKVGKGLEMEIVHIIEENHKNGLWYECYCEKKIKS